MDFSVISSPIRTFQSMVQCAISTSECIPKEDLLVAFKTSLNLLERIGELMNHNLSTHNKPTNGMAYNMSNMGNNSFLNSFSNHNNDGGFCSQSSPTISHQESLLLSNNISFPNSDNIPVSCILPISSSQTFAALNSLMKNGILSNNENLLNSRSTSDDNNSRPNSENTPETSSPYASLIAPSKQTLWHNRSRSPISSFLNQEAIISPTDLSKRTTTHEVLEPLSLKSRSERRKNMNSDELNRLLDSCEVKSTSGDLGAKKNYKCKFCGKMYDIKSSIRYHVRIIHLKMHLKAADMQCKLCGRVFTCATAANKHQSRCVKVAVPVVKDCIEAAL